MTERGWIRRHPVLSILALAAVVRLPTLVTRPLWYDEAFAVLFSAEGPRAMAYGTLIADQGVAADVHPLGYYTLLWIWQGVLGPSPILVRTLSVILGIAAVYLGYRISRHLFDAQIGLLAGAALALSPFQVHYSQEVRMYALLAALLLGATWAYIRALEGARVRSWIAFAILAAAAQYTHTLAAVYLIPLALTPLWRRDWANARRTAIAGFAAVLLYLPWLIYLPSQVSRVRWAYWIPQPGLAELVRTWLVFTAGLPVPQLALAIVLFGTLLATALAGWGTVHAKRTNDSTFSSGAWLLYLATAPVLLMFTVSYIQPVYLERALLAAGGIFLLWMVWGLSPPRLPKLYSLTGFGALLGTFVLGLIGYFTFNGFPYAPYDLLEASLEDNLQTGEIILHSNKISALPAHYYAPDQDHRFLPDPPGTGSDTLAIPTQQVLSYFAESDLGSAIKGASGVWFVVFSREEQDYIAEGYDSHPVLVDLSALFAIESVSGFGDLQLYHFVNE